MPATTLRAATAADARTIAALHAASWRAAYAGILAAAWLERDLDADRRDAWETLFRAPHPERRCVLLAERDGAAAGFVSVLLDEDPAWGARLENLHVLPSAQHGRLGCRLLAAAARWIVAGAHADTMHLMVFEANGGARRFYERMGGALLERRVETAPGGGDIVVCRYGWRNLDRLAAAAAP